MANVAFKKGLLAGLPSAHVEGTFYVTTDERALYLDVDNSTRIRLGDFQEFATIEALRANANPSTTALYYVSGANCLAKWNGTDYVQINLDTGATSVEVTGAGNAVTGASYNPATRKLTLTMGETFATKAFVGDIPEGYTQDTVIAYINKKAEETLAAAQGGSSETAASVKAQLDTYKAENDPKVAALEEKVGNTSVDAQIDAKIEALDLANTYDAKGAAATAEANAKAHADGKDAAIKEAKDAADAAQSDVDALTELVGEVAEGKTVVQMISEAQEAATYDDTALTNRVKAVEDEMDVIVGDDTGKSIRTIANEELAAQLIGENAKDSLNELHEIAAWIQSHPDDASAMNLAIQALQAKVDTGDKNVSVYVSDAIAALNIGDYAKAADLLALVARVEELEKVDHAHENAGVLDGITAEQVAAWDSAETNAKAYADGLAGNYDAKGSASTAEANAKAYADGLAGNYDAAGSASTAEANAKAYADGLAGNYDAAGAANTAEANAKAYADSLVMAWGSF